MGGKGRSVESVMQAPSQEELRQKQDQAFQFNPAIMKALQSYGKGGMNIQEAMRQAGKGYGASQKEGALSQKDRMGLQTDQWKIKQYLQSHPDDTGARQKLAETESKLSQSKMANQFNSTGFEQALATGQGTARNYATEKVGADKFMQQLYGKGMKGGGMFGNIMGEQQGLSDYTKNLRETGFGLNTGDQEAYGQLAGNLTRQSGMRQKNISSALANMGLGGAGSGSAIASFAGEAGTAQEQLANMSRQFAEDKYNKTLARLTEGQGAMMDARNSLANMANFREGAIGASQDRAAGRKAQSFNEMQQMSQNQFQKQQAEQEQRNKQFEQVEATKGPGVGGILGGAIGTLGGGALGGLGTSIGTALGPKPPKA